MLRAACGRIELGFFGQIAEDRACLNSPALGATRLELCF